MNLPTLELLHVIPTESPCLLTHIYSTINLNGSDLHQISRQPIRSHYSDPRLTLDATQLGHPLSLATHNNTIEHKIRPFHGRAQGALSKTTPPLETDHATLSWSGLPTTQNYAVVTLRTT